MLAIIKTGGKQYTVTENQTLKVEKIAQKDRKENSVVFNDVLLVADDKDAVTVGTPVISKAKVEATVIRDGKADKIRVVKYKAKVRYKRTNGHRQPFTEVRINKIVA